MKKFLPHILTFVVIIIAACGYLFYSGVLNLSGNKITINKSSHDSLEDFYKTGQDLALTDDGPNVNFLAVGDIMLSRDVARAMIANDKDANYPFRNLANLLIETDFNFGNLESPYSGKDTLNPSSSLQFNAPIWTTAGLINSNFKVLNLANNHIFDQGLDGLLYTKKHLEEQTSITTVGVGNNLDEAWQGKVIKVKGIKIGFIGASFSSLNDGGAVTNNNVARIQNTTRLIQSINDLKLRSDFIVITMHAGEEYTREPTQAQKDFAHSAIDAGADIVIGAHPHWIQPIETYKGKQIFYSLGNFVFDQEWSQDTKEGLTLKITLNKLGGCSTSSATPGAACGTDVQGNPVAAKIKQIELIPVIIENYATPRLANEVEKQKIFKKIDVTTNVITP